MGAKAPKATYVYCAVQAPRKPHLGRAPSGPPGLGTHRLLDAGHGLWLIVADAPQARFDESRIQRGLHDLRTNAGGITGGNANAKSHRALSSTTRSLARESEL